MHNTSIAFDLYAVTEKCSSLSSSVYMLAHSICTNALFFNLFSEAEPFAAILIAHGMHVFLGDS